jgi:hypothetical protein
LSLSIIDCYGSVVGRNIYVSLLQWEKGDHAVVDEVVKSASNPQNCNLRELTFEAHLI